MTMKIDKCRFHVALAKKCMTVYDLRKFNISSKTLAKVKKDGKYELNPKTFGKIAKALDVDVEYLLAKEGDCHVSA